MTFVAKQSQGRISLRKRLKALESAALQHEQAQRAAFGKTFAEANRLVGVLLQRLGGSVTITQEELTAAGSGQPSIADGDGGSVIVTWKKDEPPADASEVAEE